MARKDYDGDNDKPRWEEQKYSDFDPRRDSFFDDEPLIGGAASVALRFSQTEILHLLLATGVIAVIFTLGFSGLTGRYVLQNGFNTSLAEIGINFLLASVAAGTGFLCHEIAHKVSANRYGKEAEFRYNLMTLLVTGSLAILFGFFIIAPGAVWIKGGLSKKQNGIVSLAGPATNLALGIIFIPLFILGIYIGSDIMIAIGFFSSFLNFFIGAFNMLPLGNFDGAKIWRWNPAVWIIMAVLLVGPVIYVYFF